MNIDSPPAEDDKAEKKGKKGKGKGKKKKDDAGGVEFNF
jgi:hypothetical protein